MNRALAVACLATLAFALPARAQEGGCSKDTDCKGSRICVDKLCVDPPPVRSCGRDLDCPGDDICEQHICLPPANSKAKKTKKPSHRDLIKEARDSSAPPPAAAPAPAPDDSSAPPLVSLPPPAAEPAPAPAPTPPPATPPPAPPPALITATPEPAAATPPPATATPAAPEPTTPAPEPTPAPAASSASTPPAPPPDLITSAPPPPPLVAAPMTPPPDASAPREGLGSPLYGGALTLGLHSWSATTSETDFGIDLNADIGVRFASNLGVELLLDGNYTAMLASRTGLVAGVGLGLRLDHLGSLPGHFLLGGLGAFGAISADGVPTINVSGGAVLLQYAFPLVGPLALQAQTGLQFLSSSSTNLTLFTFSVGVAIGN